MPALLFFFIYSHLKINYVTWNNMPGEGEKSGEVFEISLKY